MHERLARIAIIEFSYPFVKNKLFARHTVIRLCSVSASMAQSRWPGPVCHLATVVFPRVCTAGFSLKYCGSAVVCSFWVSQDHRPAHVDLLASYPGSP